MSISKIVDWAVKHQHKYIQNFHLGSNIMGCTFGYHILTLRCTTKFPTDAIHNKILKTPKKGLYCIGVSNVMASLCTTGVPYIKV